MDYSSTEGVVDYSTIYVEGFQNGFEGLEFLPFLEARALESTDSDAFSVLWETYEMGYAKGILLKEWTERVS